MPCLKEKLSNFSGDFPSNFHWDKHIREKKKSRSLESLPIQTAQWPGFMIFFLFQLNSRSLSGDFTPLVLSKLVSGFLWALAGKSSQWTKKNTELLDGGTQDFSLTSEPKEWLWGVLWWVKTIILMQFIIKYCCVSPFFQNLLLPPEFHLLYLCIGDVFWMPLSRWWILHLMFFLMSLWWCKCEKGQWTFDDSLV